MHYLILGFAPGLYWLWYFYRRDELEPEPKKLVVRAYLLGILSAGLVLLIQRPMKLRYFSSAVIAAPIIEEFCKFLMVLLFFYRNKNFNEPMDGIVYASAVALGFASIENGLYLFRAHINSSFMLSNTILIRAFLSVPAHALFSSAWGYALAKYKFSKKKNVGVVLVGLLIAMLLHASFNLLAIVQILSTFGLLILVAMMWSVFNSKIAKAEADSPFAKKTSILKWRSKKTVERIKESPEDFLK
jgi:protease PrsW